MDTADLVYAPIIIHLGLTHPHLIGIANHSEHNSINRMHQ